MNDLGVYFLFLIPPLVIGLLVQYRLKRTVAEYMQVEVSTGMTGAEVARAILDRNGLNDVPVERAPGGPLSDHYNPRNRSVFLSEPVHDGRAVASTAIGAHEVGHAIQHAERYAFLGMRSALVPAMSFASPLAVPIIIGGFLLSSFVGTGVGQLVTLAGLGLFAVVVLFQLVTLPVEFDASRRALAAIQGGGLLHGREVDGAKDVLSAAAWTYVAAAVSAVLTLLYFLIRSGLLGGSRRE